MKLENKETKWLGRSLEGYKTTHRKAAEEKGRLEEFLSAKTITEAKKIAYGIKKKQDR